MYSLNLAFKQKTKKITLPKNINTHDLLTLIEESFRLREKVIGLTNTAGQLITLEQIQKNPFNYQKEILYLITTQDMNEDNMSFASDHGDNKNIDSRQKKVQDDVDSRAEILQKSEGFYKGVIGNLQLFEELFLQENDVSVVFCFVKEKPKNFMFPYFLYHTSRNSAIIYSGQTRVCEFFIQSMNEIPKQIQLFIRSLIGTSAVEQLQPQKPFAKIKSKTDSKINTKREQSPENLIPENKSQQNHNNQMVFEADEKLLDLNEDQNSDDDENRHIDEDEQNNGSLLQEEEDERVSSSTKVKASLLQNLTKLRNDGDITDLEFYKMKSELLQNISDFMRKYQMGTRKGFRKETRSEREQVENGKSPKKFYNQSKKKQYPRQDRQRKLYNFQEKEDKQSEVIRQSSQGKGIPHPAYSREQRRSKKYEIPIIVRKYNNVIEKISTSYPLTQEQQQSINLILELQLKGLISQKQSGIYKSSILQEDTDTLPLFLDYFDNLIDQIQLVSRLKRIKKINSEKKQRSQHDMRLLIKYAKQGSYELLRNLLLDKNHLVLAALDKFRIDNKSERLAARLEKIAIVYRQKGELEDEVFE